MAATFFRRTVSLSLSIRPYSKDFQVYRSVLVPFSVTNNTCREKKPALFDRLVIRGLGIDRHPALLKTIFANYRKLVYLVQVPRAGKVEQARSAAERLGLEFDYQVTGYGGLEHSLKRANQEVVFWQN